jgi:hypothetical protein
MKKKKIGSTFDSWLREEGIYEEASANAIKRVMVRQLTSAKTHKRPRNKEADNRLLDHENGSIT